MSVKTDIRMFTAALFLKARNWRQSKISINSEWLNKLWYIYTMEHDMTIKRGRNY